MKDGNPFNRLRYDEVKGGMKNDANKNMADVLGKNMSLWSLLMPFTDHGEKIDGINYYMHQCNKSKSD